MQNYLEHIIQDLTLLKYKKAWLEGNHIETEEEFIIYRLSSEIFALDEFPTTTKQLVLCILGDDGTCLYYKLNKSQ